MRPLTLDDLMPLGEYAARRRELFEAQRRYIDRYRRVRIGPRAALLFENRQTLWFRIQEIVRIARLTEPVLVQQQLELYSRLLPGPNELRAGLLVEPEENAKLPEDLAFWQTLTGNAVRLRLGNHLYEAALTTCRPEDRTIGSAQWVQFTLDTPARQLLTNFRQPAYCEIDHAAYPHRSQPLSEDIRQSLAEDLELSGRD